jgi:hypothetical protein
MSINTTPKNFKEFRGYVQKYGFSLSNFYDVQFEMISQGNQTNNLMKNLLTLGMTGDKNINDEAFMQGLIRVYADECSIPGYSISTGDYRITNTPTMKYAYGIVNNEITISFILDADSQIRRIFDAWGNYIYTGVSLTGANVSNTNINMNSRIDLGRTRYRDDYCCDIIVIKLERDRSSKKNTRLRNTTFDTGSNFYRNNEIIPDYKGDLLPGFGKPFATYSVRLRNAFPTTISAIPLSSGSSQLVKVQATFEYDLAVPSSQTGEGSTRITTSWSDIT